MPNTSFSPITPSSKNRSVCLVVNGLYLAGGKHYQARLMAAKLYQAGVRVCIIDCCSPEKYRSEKGVRCRFDNAQTLPSEIEVFSSSPRELIKQLWLARDHYDVVYFMEEMCLPGCFVFLKLLGKKIVVLFTARHQQGEHTPWHQRNAWNLLDCLIVVSEAVKRDFLSVSGARAYQKKMRMILNRVDQRAIREVDAGQKKALRERLGLDTSNKIVIFAGGVQFSKGIDLLFEAWMLIRERVTAARLLIIGPLCFSCEYNVDYRGRLTQAGKDLFAQKTQIFTSKISSLISAHERIDYMGVKQNVSDYLAASDVFVFPSRLEGSPHAPVEAMAAGVPVVAFDRKEIIGEIVRDSVEGILVPYEDSAALAEAVVTLLEDDEKRRILGDNGRSRFKKELVFDQKHTERFIELFNSL